MFSIVFKIKNKSCILTLCYILSQVSHHGGQTGHQICKLDTPMMIGLSFVKLGQVVSEKTLVNVNERRR